MCNQLSKVEDAIGYKFKNYDLLQQAFVRRSYSQENGGQNNEVLEFVGDKALDLAVIRLLVMRFGVMTEDKEWNELKLRNPKYFKTKSKEGIFTDIKKDLVQKKALADAMNDLGFQEMLIMGAGDEKKNIQDVDSVKEDLFESIIGAVAIDCDWNMSTITNVVESMIDFDAYFNNEDFDFNYVGKLQEWAQGQGIDTPHYSYYSSWNGDVICQVLLGGSGYYQKSFNGKGASKAKARMDAAKEAYEYLDQNGYIPNEFIQAVGEPSEEDALKQINELVQKGLTSEPKYQFDRLLDRCGEPYWECKVSQQGKDYGFRGDGNTKKEAQRRAAYELLLDLMGTDDAHN